jgi:hypothetical protein
MGKEQGNSIGVLDAMRGDIRDKGGKKNAVKSWGGYGREVPVEIRLHRDDWIDGEDGV